MPKLWNIKTLTPGRKLIIELEPRDYGTSLIVVDHRHHHQGSRLAKVLMRGPDVPKDVKEDDRILIRGSSGTTVESQDHDYSGTYRIIKYADIIAVIGDGVKVQVY